MLSGATVSSMAAVEWQMGDQPLHGKIPSLIGQNDAIVPTGFWFHMLKHLVELQAFDSLISRVLNF